jgi:tryptophan-rich sensory protein
MKVWYFVGAVYYVIFGIIGYRQFSTNSSVVSTAIILLVLVMIVNGLSNFIIFKYHSLKWFYLIIYPFGLLLFALITVLAVNDELSAILASLYLSWLIYDIYYCYSLWKLNP